MWHSGWQSVTPAVLVMGSAGDMGGGDFLGNPPARLKTPGYHVDVCSRPNKRGDTMTTAIRMAVRDALDSVVVRGILVAAAVGWAPLYLLHMANDFLANR